MTLKARLAMVKRVPAGVGVSYGLTWTAPRPSTLGLIPLGYGDGLPRHASNGAPVQSRGVSVVASSAGSAWTSAW